MYKRQLYDALGDGYGLIRFDRDVAVDGLVAAAKRRGVPFNVLHIDDAEAAALYAKKLVLVRPDRHVAWRADVEPDDPLALIDLIRGVPALVSRERVLAAAPAANLMRPGACGDHPPKRDARRTVSARH